MADKWRWNQTSLQWEVYDRESRGWLFEHHRLPQWFLTEQGIVTPKRFILIWQNAKSFSDVKRDLFWWSVEEVEAFAEKVNQFLKAAEIEPLQELDRLEQPWIEREDLDDLLSRSVLKKEEYAQDSADSYDPMRALLQAQKQRDSSELSSIETMEVTGRYRFQARH